MVIATKGLRDRLNSAAIPPECRIAAEVQTPAKLAQAVAAVVIALFWCISSLATTVGVMTLATAVGAATSPAQAGEKDRKRRRRRQSRRRQRRYRNNKWEWYWAPYWAWDYY
jgi:hypothetical protein